jgi:hypothetical protein
VTIKRWTLGVFVLLALAACGPSDIETQANDAAATVAAQVGGLGATAEALANDPTAQALAGEVEATIEAVAGDPTAQAALATAEALGNDPTAQALLASAEALANDPTAQALANDPTAQAAVNEALATMEAVANDPTSQALAATAAGSVSESDLQAALNEAFASADDAVTLVEGQPLDLDALAGLANVSNYRMTVVEAPAGAEAAEGQVIKEASDGNISLEPEEYEQYFTTAGDYTIRLDVTSGGESASSEFTVTVP